MRLITDGESNIFEAESGFTKEYFAAQLYEITKMVNSFAKKQQRHLKSVYDANLEINLGELETTVALRDALDDLRRLKDFHPVQDPSPIKQRAYVAYWFLRRKPLHIINLDEIDFDHFNYIDKQHLLYFHEFFLVTFLLTAVFDSRTPTCTNYEKKLADKQLKTIQNYLFYFLCFRVESPKSLEAILLAFSAHPIWPVNSAIWHDVFVGAE